MISSSQRPLPDNTQHSQQTNIHAPGGIRTHDLSRRAASDQCLRLRGHWDRLLVLPIHHKNNAKKCENESDVNNKVGIHRVAGITYQPLRALIRNFCRNQHDYRTWDIKSIKNPISTLVQNLFTHRNQLLQKYLSSVSCIFLEIKLRVYFM